MDAAISLYRDRLGLRLALDKSFKERGVRLLFFRIGGITVEVGAQLAGPEESETDDDRLWGLAYRVADADAAQRRLAETKVDSTDVR